MRPGAKLVGLVLLLLTCLVPVPASADDATTSAIVTDRALDFDATSVFGLNTIDGGGDEVYVEIRNSGTTAKSGTIELGPGGLGMSRRYTSASYSVEPGSSAGVHLPIVSGNQVTVVARDPSGVIRYQTTLSAAGAGPVRVLDVGGSRIGATISTTYVDPEYRVQYGYSSISSAPLLLQVVPCRVDRATGDPVLPEYVTGWRSVHLALINSDLLAHVTGAQLAAFESFVLGGGTVAVVVTHPEDLRQPTLVALIGGQATKTRATPQLLAPLRAPLSGGTPRWSQVPANPADTTEVAGYAGGNLESTPFGANASYGLGEVVLLGFDPTTPEGAADPWVQMRIADLARRAYERNSTVVFGPASPPVRNYTYSYEDDLQLVRRELDPNQSSRFAIGVATGILCVYALIAGPFAFWRARKRKKPLRALWALPILSALTFFLVVSVGFYSRGASSRSRRLTFVDAAAGMSHGVGHRFRGFFSAVSQDLTIVATDRTSVFSTERVDPSGESGEEWMSVDRDGTRLENLAAIPWQTVLAHERGLASLGQGISVTASQAGSNDVIVKNRTGRRLRAIVIRLPTGEVRYQHELANGAQLDTRELEPTPSFANWSTRLKTMIRSGRTDVHALGSSWLNDGLVKAGELEIGSNWIAAESTVQSSVDWFPYGVPVVLAAFDGDVGHTTDAGMNIDFDRTLVRVVGWGGEP